MGSRLDDELHSLARAAARLIDLAGKPTPSGLTEPDGQTGEQWDATHVWSHLAEFGDYWLSEWDSIVTSDGPEPPPFGRTKADPERRARIERGRPREPSAHLATVLEHIARWSAAIVRLTDAELERTGRHPTLGEMTVWEFLDEFVTGHYHEHANQLDALLAGDADG